MLPVHREPEPEEYRDAFNLDVEFDLARVDSTLLELCHAYINPINLTPEVFVLAPQRITIWACPKNGISTFILNLGPGNVTVDYTRRQDHINLYEYTSGKTLLPLIRMLQRNQSLIR